MQGSNRFDVAVIGGGVAGVCAAVQSARAGASTLLVEKTAQLGGTLTNGGVERPGLFHAWGRQVIAGIGWDLVAAAVAEAGGRMPDFADAAPPHWRLQPTVDPFLFAALCDEAVLRSGVTLLCHVMLAAAADTGEGWRLTLCTKTGLDTVNARILVDCTGDASAVAMAGGPLQRPESSQPATLSFQMSGYEVTALDLPALDNAFRQAVESGELKAEDACWQVDRPSVSGCLRKHGMNANHVAADPGAATSAGRTQLEVESRAAVRRLVRWLRRQPGLENLHLDCVFPETGVRETARILGEVVITVDDYCSGRVWADAICHAFYPIDQHGLSSADWQVRQLREGTVATVPVRALIPAGSRRLLAAGRIVSADRLAFSALRVQATCMATGQAAGGLAALAAAGRLSPQEVALPDLRGLLQQHGAMVPAFR